MQIGWFSFSGPLGGFAVPLFRPIQTLRRSSWRKGSRVLRNFALFSGANL